MATTTFKPLKFIIGHVHDTAMTHLESPAEEDPLCFSVIYNIYVLIYTYTNINKIFVRIVVSVHGLIINGLHTPCSGVRGAQVSSALGP